MEIVNVREQSGNDKIVMIFDIKLDLNDAKYPMTFRNWKVRRSKTGGTYIDSPSFIDRDEKDGTKVWGKFVEISPHCDRDFRDKVKELVESLNFKDDPF